LLCVFSPTGCCNSNFFLFNVLPGDPARMMLGQNESEEQVAIVKKKYGFDLPITYQYLYYLNDLSPLSFHASTEDHYTYLNTDNYKAFQLVKLENAIVVAKLPNFRDSFQKNGKSVAKVIGETLPNTIILAVASIVIAIATGLFLGVIAANYKDTFIDQWLQVFSTLGMSVPSFFSAILFAWFFGYVIHDITGLSMSGSLYVVDDFGEKKMIVWKNLILPALVLGIRPLAVILQLVRSSLLEVLQQDYIRTAKAKGLTKSKIMQKHALKNALNPVITAVSGWFASMLAGAVFVEYIFGWNGIGKELVDALNTLDLPIIMGIVLVIATMFLAINSFVDVVYAWLDPKIRLG